MNPISAVFRCYVGIVKFSGRAPRAEYWWFALFLFLVAIAAQIGAGVMLARSPMFAAQMAQLEFAKITQAQSDALLRMSVYGVIGYFVLFWLPQLSVTIRRLHDTNRSGWYIFMPFAASLAAAIAAVFLGIGMGGARTALPLALLCASVPVIASLWFLVILCLPSTQGTNRFGPDPLAGRRAQVAGHPAFAQRNLDPETQAAQASARRAEIRSYYRNNVLSQTRKT
jgi:uncharacterized membrane protein YhaH (DUF805 family)